MSYLENHGRGQAIHLKHPQLTVTLIPDPPLLGALTSVAVGAATIGFACPVETNFEILGVKKRVRGEEGEGGEEITQEREGGGEEG